MFGWTWNSSVETADPAGFVTVIGPVVAVGGTTAVSSWFETTWNEAATPLKLTDLVAVNRVPWIVTVIPVGPSLGENDVIVGGSPAATRSGSDAIIPSPSTAATNRRRTDDKRALPAEELSRARRRENRFTPLADRDRHGRSEPRLGAVAHVADAAPERVGARSRVGDELVL
jgi:hypothetical protein